jgi:limonene-1,2-epoxide hydrolase
MTGPEVVVAAYVDALNRADADAVAACVAEDFENVHPVAGATSTSGRAAYRARLPRFFAELPGLRYEVLSSTAEGGHVVLAYRLTARAQGPDGAWRPLAVDGCFELDVAGGLVTRRVDAWDADAVARQLAPHP